MIDKQIRAMDKLSGELARIEVGGQQSGSVEGLKNKSECQDLQFVGGWVDENDKHSEA